MKAQKLWRLPVVLVLLLSTSLARDFGNAEIYTGARTAERHYYLEECQKIADVHIATDDGSLGFKGFVTEMLRARLQEMSTGRTR